jgi:general secretion pathway protein I
VRALGFTLLEVMVALALLAAALMAIAELSGSALRNHTYARDLTAATLLARGKLAELEQKYEDSGFKDFDEEEEGDFADQARPDIRWKLEMVRPSTDLSADQLVSTMTGAGLDPQELLSKLTGGAGASLAAAALGGGPTSSAAGTPAAGMLTKLIQAQLTSFGETLKKSFREMRLTVSWPDGKASRGFTVTSHLVVLNPRAPGGARGDNPEVPANLAAAGPLPGAGAPGQQPTVAPGQQQQQDGSTRPSRRRRRTVQENE